MLKERMTPEELAMMTGYSRQTINKWVRKEGWETSPKPGVQGGKARLIHVDEQVRNFIRSTQRAADKTGVYIAAVPDTPLEILLRNSLKEMTASEQKQMTSLLLREGISGLLLRLGIRSAE
ncbi:YfeC-like transcriptional regulator [Franconibacter daqui]|uniref:YfeC-like transcriptional regulator n=1 Tax=Franconibacter daqui TaxID=2047724 RepID=UPI0030D216A8